MPADLSRPAAPVSSPLGEMLWNLGGLLSVLLVGAFLVFVL